MMPDLGPQGLTVTGYPNETELYLKCSVVEPQYTAIT